MYTSFTLFWLRLLLTTHLYSLKWSARRLNCAMPSPTLLNQLTPTPLAPVAHLLVLQGIVIEMFVLRLWQSHETMPVHLLSQMCQLVTSERVVRRRTYPTGPTVCGFARAGKFKAQDMAITATMTGMILSHHLTCHGAF